MRALLGTEAHRREDREYDKIRDEARKSMERKHRERMEALQRRGTGEILWSHNSASSERQYVEEPLPDTKEFGEEHIRNKREARQETRTGDAPPRRPPSKTGPSKMGPSDTGRPKKSFGILTLANFMRRNR